jgi:hypothetical protein
MILVRDKNNKYIGTMRRSDFLRLTNLKKMPNEFVAESHFILFYALDDYLFYTVPFCKSKSTLRVVFNNGNYYIDDRG